MARCPGAATEICVAYRTCLDYRRFFVNQPCFLKRSHLVPTPPHRVSSSGRRGGCRFVIAAPCRNFRLPAPTTSILPRPSSMTPVQFSPGIGCDPPFPRVSPQSGANEGVRHETCFARKVLKKSSQCVAGSVNSGHRSAKSVSPAGNRSERRGGVEREWSCRLRGWNHGAARNGYRKRTRVRVACGVTIRPRGVGTLSSHGHFGRSVDGSFLLPVVLLPVREGSLRRGHLSRGPGLPAATLTVPPVGFVRMSALAADSMSWATRPRRAVVNRATSAPAQPAGLSGGWARRTRPDPRTRLQRF